MAATGLAAVAMLTVGIAAPASASNYPDWWHQYGDYKCGGHSAKSWHSAGYNVTFGSNAVEETILGTDQTDSIFELGGVDVVCGGSGNDWLIGGDDRGYLYGEAGNDQLVGDPNCDIIHQQN